MDENRLGEERIVPLVLKMALPIMLAMAFQAIYNIADSLFISRYSSIAFGGVSIIQPALLIATALSNGVAAGTGSLLSKCLGARDEEKAGKAVSTGWGISIVLSIVSSVVLFLIARPFSLHFSSDPVASHAAISYLRIISPFLPFFAVASLISFILQSHGMAKKAMVIQSTGAILNIVLDPIFIFSMSMGVKGASLASGLGYFCSFIVAIVFYIKSECTKASPNIDKDACLRILRIALPSTMAQGAGPIVGIVLNKLIVGYGIAVMSVYGMYLKTESFMFLASHGISSALIVIVGYNYGKKDYKRVRKSFWVSLGMSWTVMIIGFVIFQVFAKYLVSMFTKNPELIEIGVPAFRSLCFCFLLTSPNIIMTGLLQGLGRGELSLAITYSRFFLFLIPISFALERLWGLSGLWFCYFASDIPTVFLLVFIYRKVNREMLSERL